MEETNMEENSACIFPKCNDCGNGYLLPFSYKEDVFEKWKCSSCGKTIEKR
jgi:transposase-like protein